MLAEFDHGQVWLVGAGPGDPDLLTRKAERLLCAATVVFYDALIGPAILGLIPSSVRLVPVGKRSGRHSRDQDSINALLVAAAQASERVVRLKGGDPSLFGRAAEEIAALAAAGFTPRICPGVTTASAAAASAGVSLSLRGLARRVQFITAHSANGQPLAIDWQGLADPGSTLAIYMGRAAAGDIGRNLMAHGLSAATPVLVACNVSLPTEQLVRTRLDLLAFTVDAVCGDRPTLIIIGDAVGGGTVGDDAVAADRVLATAVQTHAA